jgi:hypothetical protein
VLDEKHGKNCLKHKKEFVVVRDQQVYSHMDPLKPSISTNK